MRRVLETIHYTSDISLQKRNHQATESDYRLSLQDKTISEKTINHTALQEKASSIRRLTFKRHDHLSFVHYSLWRIRSGYVRTFTHNAEGDIVPLGFWSEGDIVGYPIAQVSPYVAECLTTVEAECLSSNQPLSREIVLNQIQQSTSLLRIAYYRDSRQRILQFVCWLAEHFGSTCAQGIQIDLKLTHQEIAESVGTTRVTVTRLLKALEQDNQIVWRTQEKIVFTDTFKRSRLQGM